MNWEEFKKVMAVELSLDPEDIHFDSKLQWDLGVDSFQKVTLALYFEDEFGIEFDDADLVATLTPGFFYYLVKELMSGSVLSPTQ